MCKTYRPWNPDQGWLLPPSPRDWLPENDVVYFVLDTVADLDPSAITRKYDQEDRGFPPMPSATTFCTFVREFSPLGLGAG